MKLTIEIRGDKVSWHKGAYSIQNIWTSSYHGEGHLVFYRWLKYQIRMTELDDVIVLNF